MHEFDLSAADEALAKEIVKLTDGFDFSDTNLFRTLILGKPEERDPKRYAEIFFAARHFAKTLSWMYFACLIESINGMRRVKGADMPLLVKELQHTVTTAGDALPNGDNKYNLLGASFYNLGIMRRGLRQYKESAQDQRRASAWYGLSGNTEKQLVCLFVAQVEEVTAAFVGGDNDSIQRSIFALVAMRDHIEETVEPYPVWMEQNASIHIAWAVTMANFVFRNDDGYSGSFFRREGKLASDVRNWENSSSAHWAQAARVSQIGRKEDFLKVIKENPVDIQSSSANNALLTVHIFVALAHEQLGHEEETKKILKTVAHYDGPDGGIPISVAKALLLAMNRN